MKFLRCASNLASAEADASVEADADSAEPERADKAIGTRAAKGTHGKGGEQMLRRTVGQSVLALLGVEKATQRRSPAALGQAGVWAGETSHPPKVLTVSATRKTLAHESQRHGPARLRIRVQPEDAIPRHQSGRRWTRKRLDRGPIALRLVVVVALAVAVSPSHGMSETTPPHADSPAPEFSAADAVRKGNEAYHRKDFAKAMQWYRQAADQGVQEAQNSIGKLYLNGWGVTQDYGAAMQWFRRAADQGYTAAHYNIGLLYERGWGVERDYGEAMRWFRKAADQGNAFAQTHIGGLYYLGQGVAQDYDEALRWYHKAADQGNASAQTDIGWLYEHGVGVAQDYGEAMNWYRKAASQGNVSARSVLQGCTRAAGGWRRITARL